MIRIRKSEKTRQYNIQKKTDKQSSHKYLHKKLNIEQHEALKPDGELRCCGGKSVPAPLVVQSWVKIKDLGLKPQSC